MLLPAAFGQVEAPIRPDSAEMLWGPVPIAMVLLVGLAVVLLIRLQATRRAAEETARHVASLVDRHGSNQ
ncbi:MAG TPA: hypothetical protein VGR26_07795 [Acidimicrobiales bacterium]|nr:hypothetical protein [Acidimicrobiales bacterium]